MVFSKFNFFHSKRSKEKKIPLIKSILQDFYTKIIYLQEKVNIKINLFCGNKLQFHNFAQKKIRFSKFSILKFKIFTKKFASFNSYLKYMNNSFSENFS